MTSAREKFGPRVKLFVVRKDDLAERFTQAAICRAEARLKALTASYEDQCSRIRAELLLELKDIERGE